MVEAFLTTSITPSQSEGTTLLAKNVARQDGRSCETNNDLGIAQHRTTLGVSKTPNLKTWLKSK
mgnify:FL=1